MKHYFSIISIMTSPMLNQLSSYIYKYIEIIVELLDEIIQII